MYIITKNDTNVRKHMLKKLFVHSIWGIETPKSQNGDIRMSSKAGKHYSQKRSIQCGWQMGPIHNPLENSCIRI